MGRRRSPVIQYFELTKDEQAKCEKATCRFCGVSSAKNTLRMKRHLVKVCANCPANVKAEFESQIDPETESVSGEESEASASEEPTGLDTSQISEKRRRKSSGTGHKGQKKKRRRSGPDRSLLQEEHQEIDRALADYLFAANLPLATLENPYFVTFCKKLRPTYTLPTRHRVVTQNFLQAGNPVTYYSPDSSAATSSSLPVQFIQPGPSTPEQQHQQGYQLIRITTAPAS